MLDPSPGPGASAGVQERGSRAAILSPDGLPAPARILSITRIRPSQGWLPLDLRGLWEYRELIYFLVWRDVKVRYKQTIFGAAWAIFQPFLAMVVFSIFFGRLAGIPSEGVPYPVFAFTALVPWTYFANALTQCSNSLVDQAALISKVYFPRLIVPLAAVLAGLLDFMMAFLVLLGMMLLYGILPTPAMWTLPLFLLLSVGTAFGAGVWLAVLNVEYRDVRYVAPFLVQLWLFCTPIAYPSSLVPEGWRTVYALNPMTGVVEGFRWALLNQTQPHGPTLIVSALVVVGLVISGVLVFRRVEDSFADVI
jgi:lipopolysaccharide transport system permease protein